MGLYDEDLARIHDAAFTDVAEAAARHVMDLTQPGISWDMGCGGGAFSEVLATGGWQVAGFDVSPAMVALAAARVPGGRFWVDDVRTAMLADADVITATAEVLNYACHDMDAMTQVFQRVHAALPTGGWFVFDVATVGRASKATTTTRQGPGWRVQATSHSEGRILRRTIDTWWDTPQGPRHGQEVHTQALFEVDEIEAMLGACGFQVEPLAGYDDHGFEPGWDGFEARA